MNSLFDGLKEAQVSEILRNAKVNNVPAGTVLMTEGETVDKLYVLRSGEVEVRKNVNGKEAVLGTISPGDFFGEPTNTQKRKSSVSIVSTEDCIVMSFGKAAAAAMMEKYPRICQNVATVLSSRLRASNDALKNQIEIQRVSSEKEIARRDSIALATQTVNSSLDLDRILELILQEATRITSAERGTIYLVDEATDEIWARKLIGDEIKEIRQPMAKGISGYVARTGETVNIINAYEDSRFNPEFDQKSGFKTKNVLCVPMRNRDSKIIGVFQLFNKKHGNFDFDQEDEDSLKAFSVNAAIAIENSRIAQQMVQTERLSVVGRMAGSIIHDIKNPMSTIRLYAQVIKKKSGNEEASNLVDEIIKQTDRLVNMAQEVLDFSKGVTQMNIQTVTFDEFLSGVFAFLQKDFEKRNIQINNEKGYPGEIEMDVDKMTRVFLNIAGNAADAMPDGGTFTVRTHADDGALTIELQDTGTGMPENIRKKIFEPFVTYGKKTGTGLGMAIVKKILDEHSAEMEIQSELGKGTKMIMHIPLKQKKRDEY